MTRSPDHDLKQRLIDQARQRKQQRGSQAPPSPSATSTVDERFTRFDLQPGYQQLGMMRRGGEQFGIRDPFFKVHEGIAGATTQIGGHECINFASYNYLGFSGHPVVNQAAIEALEPTAARCRPAG